MLEEGRTQMPLEIVILAAGMGRRLGHQTPKCLASLREDTSILDRQLASLADLAARITVVVGFAKEAVMAAHPEVLYAFNPRFNETNTARSLQCALAHVDGADVLWLNGDVAFDAEIVRHALSCPRNVVCVNTSAVGEEEVKYSLDADGNIQQLSKTVAKPIGEAVGINLVRAGDLHFLRDGLMRCNDEDYFEKGIENAIEMGLVIRPCQIDDLRCVEIDTQDDLEVARRMFSDEACL